MVKCSKRKAGLGPAFSIGRNLIKSICLNLFFCSYSVHIIDKNPANDIIKILEQINKMVKIYRRIVK